MQYCIKYIKQTCATRRKICKITIKTLTETNIFDKMNLLVANYPERFL